MISLFLFMVSCKDDDLYNYDYTSRGEDVSLTLAISLPEMDTKTRANLEDWQTDQVDNVWIATYDALSGEMTSLTNDGKTTGWYKIDNPADYIEPLLKNVTINTKSGSAYIVAVANVQNIGTTKTNLSERQPLSKLLENAEKWEDFLDIAILAPSSYEDVNSPQLPLPMSGAYTNTHISELGNWQNENMVPYPIAKGKDGTFKLDGAIHLRRLVAQNTFEITSGEDVSITPNGYRIINVPVYSWLYERPTNGEKKLVSNFGDNCSFDDKDDYYVSTDLYPASSFEQDGNTYSFNFWQSENKHVGTFQSDDPSYKMRQEQKKINNENSGLFTALIGGNDKEWSPNNMATYVLIECTVEYKEKLNVDDNGNINSDGNEVWRSGNAIFMIHLGYLNDKASDFNCYRNTKYTYKITVNGIDDIRVEAFGNNETPGVEGLVSDVTNPTYNLDCHYHCFNIQLTDEDLSPFKQSGDGIFSGFGFIISTYDNNNGGLKNYEETDFIDKSYDELDENIKKYVNWVELRKTSGEDILAQYKPRDGENSDGLTFNLIDASKGIYDYHKSTVGDKNGNWYTVFVNEYTYEADKSDERMPASTSTEKKQKPLWQSYVNAEPRRFYIKVTRSISSDGQSIYARSKYAGMQQSILSYYSSNTHTESNGKNVTGSAIGLERENESLGLNLRRSFVDADNPNNGRYNTWLFLSSNNINQKWESVIDPNKPQAIKGFSYGDLYIPERIEYLPKIFRFTGDLKGGLNITNVMNNEQNGNGKNLLNAESPFDPQPNSSNYEDYIEAINACMNRNRDNNGDGIIDKDEVRWYIPAMGKYLRIILGNRSLGDYPLMNYNEIDNIRTNTRYGKTNNDGISYIDGTTTAGYCGRHLFFSSDGRILWAGEGFSSSYWCQWGLFDPVAPWQVRCIRNLGTDLGNIYSEDQTVKAYQLSGNTVKMSFYEINSIRNIPYSGNGNDNPRYMRVHRQSNSTYNTLYSAFEISPGIYASGDVRYDISKGISSFTNKTESVAEWINENPCKVLDNGNGGWRVPNIKELAIMRSEEFTKGLNDGWGSSEFILSCSTNTFNTEGYNTEEGLHLFFVARSDAITILNPDQFSYQPNGKLFIRCVRDVEP